MNRDDLMASFRETNKLRFSDSWAFSQAIGSVTLPSGRVLKGVDQFNPYRDWQGKNKYFGKQFSILGDSISTLEGYNPKGYDIFYTGEACDKTGVHAMKDTWWGKVIDYFGGELLVNNSWSGSRVTKLPNCDTLFPSGCSDERTGALHIGEAKPDVIIVYLGTNDWGYGVKDEEIVDRTTVLFNGHNTEGDESVFAAAYHKMLFKLRTNYPKAKIFCCTLCETFMSSNPSFNFQYTYSGTHIERYNNIIRWVAEQEYCSVVDLYNEHVPYDAVDGSHPTADGMNTLATLMLRSMCDSEGAAFLDCDGTHDFVVAEEYTGGSRQVCRRCGFEKHNSTLFPPNNKLSNGMHIVKCVNGHFFDRVKYAGCPYCEAEAVDEESRKGIVSPHMSDHYSEYERFWNIFGGILLTSSMQGYFGYPGQYHPKNYKSKLFPLEIGMTYKLEYGTEIRIDEISEDRCTLTICPDGVPASHNNAQEEYPKSMQVKWEEEADLPLMDTPLDVICTLSVRIKKMIDYSTKGKITEFSISSVDLLVTHYEYQAGTLKGYNRINGSRDGHMQFPGGFFDDVVVTLDRQQEDAIQEFLGTVQLSDWKTDYGIVEKFGCAGFCIASSFSCKFDDGSEFVYYSSGKNPDEFNKLIQFLKFICPLPAYTSFVEPKPVQKVDPDIIDLNPDCTVLLYSVEMGISLYSESKGENITIYKSEFNIGRDQECAIRLTDSLIARLQATIFFENSSWLLRDNHSTNGTWLNDTKLIPGKKYVLHPDDVIDFAHREKFIAFISRPALEEQKKGAQKAVSFLESAIGAFHDSGHKDELAFKVAISSLVHAPLYVPVAMDMSAMFGDIDPTKIQTITVNGNVFFPLFTSTDELNKGSAASTTRFYPQDYLPKIIPTGKDIVINPFGEKAFTVNQKMMQELIYPMVKQEAAKADRVIVANTETDWIGKQIGGKYEAMRLLGRGGMSVVYLAEDLNHKDKQWAVKIHTKTSSGFNHLRAAILQEAHMMMQFNHPAIPKIIDIVEDEDNLIIVRDYIEGCTLSELVKNKGSFKEADVLSIGLRLAAALNYLHAFNPPYIYRDMKPENVMVTDSREIKLIDFGIAIPAPHGKADDDAHIIGTRGYAPPEQFAGRADQRSDIYSLGMTLHYLLTGISQNEPPYVTQPVRQINPAISAGLEYIIQRCIRLNPDERYASCVEVITDLNNVQNLPPKKGLFANIFGKK